MPVPLTGQVAISGSAQPLSASTVNAVAFTIKAASGNVNPVYIGPSGVTASSGYQLDAGDVFEYQTNDQSGQSRFQLRLSDFFAIGTAGSDKVTWVASPLP